MVLGLLFFLLFLLIEYYSPLFDKLFIEFLPTELMSRLLVVLNVFIVMFWCVGFRC